MNAAEALREARRRFGAAAIVQDHGTASAPGVRYVVKAKPDARGGTRDGFAAGPSFDECFRRLDKRKRAELEKHRTFRGTFSWTGGAW